MKETRMTKDKCVGCYNNDYNLGLGGSKECWSFKDAKLISRKRVHINQMPPWKQAPVMIPSCYSRPQYVFVAGDKEC